MDSTQQTEDPTMYPTSSFKAAAAYAGVARWADLLWADFVATGAAPVDRDWKASEIPCAVSCRLRYDLPLAIQAVLEASNRQYRRRNRP
jgi:hypothetical protein